MAIHRRSGSEIEDVGILPRFTQAGMLEVPKNRLSEREMLPQTAYQIVSDGVMLDGLDTPMPHEDYPSSFHH